nr:unnamed protein product [Callosobruchus analis]
MAHEKLNDFSLKDEWSTEWTNNNISNKNLIQDPQRSQKVLTCPEDSGCLVKAFHSDAAIQLAVFMEYIDILDNR